MHIGKNGCPLKQLASFDDFVSQSESTTSEFLTPTIETTAEVSITTHSSLQPGSMPETSTSTDSVTTSSEDTILTSTQTTITTAFITKTPTTYIKTTFFINSTTTATKIPTTVPS